MRTTGNGTADMARRKKDKKKEPDTTQPTATPKGPDYLGYYELLGVPVTATHPEIKSFVVIVIVIVVVILFCCFVIVIVQQ